MVTGIEELAAPLASYGIYYNNVCNMEQSVNYVFGIPVVLYPSLGALQCLCWKLPYQVSLTIDSRPVYNSFLCDRNLPR